MISANTFKQRILDEWIETPLIKIEGVYFKLEHQNPTGSVKGRGLAWQIFHLLEQNQTEAVISSSGNAAYAAAYFGELAGIKIHTYLPVSVDPEKVSLIKQHGATVNISREPILRSIQFAQQEKLMYIRQSADPVSLMGYESSLVAELIKQFSENRIDSSDAAIFFPVSSATTMSGVHQGFINELATQQIPQMHAVQTVAVNTIAANFDQDFRRKARSIVPGIVARKRANTHYDLAMSAIKDTGGFGWVVTDEQTKKQHDWLTAHGVPASLEGAMALAGLIKSQQAEYVLRQIPVILLT